MGDNASSDDGDRGAAFAGDAARLLVQMRAANEHLLLAAISAEQQAEAATAEREAARYNELRLRALAAIAVTVFWEADPEGHIEVDREAWRRFIGAPYDASAPNLGWLQAIPPEERDAVARGWANALAAGEPYTGQHRLLTASGDAWVAVRAVPIVVDGVLRDWIGTLTDVTELVRVERAKDRFLGILGRDLRMPLADIALGAELFRDLPEPYALAAQQLRRSAQRMEVMIRDMLDLTQAQRLGGIPTTREPCDLGVLALEITREVRRAHPTRDLACDVHGALDGLFDPIRAGQVFGNLLDNAILHGADPIRLMVIGQGDDIFVSVQNRGAAIPAAVIATLFEPFSRRGVTAAPGGPLDGLGLGLYLVREIVAAHGGSIAISSSQADGTEVAIRWPRRPGRPAA
jgi:signal transduction histidine kinase